MLTADGRAAPIRWIGRRRVSLAAHPRPELVQPVRIAAHAFGPNLPKRDLVVSPGHGLLWGDTPDTQVLIPAGELVDGRTIARLDVESVDYLHLELDRHDIVLAEGLPAESWLDTGHRADFEGGGAALTLHPTFAAMAHELACRPFALVGPQVDAARARLAESVTTPLEQRSADEGSKRFGNLGHALRRFLEVLGMVPEKASSRHHMELGATGTYVGNLQCVRRKPPFSFRPDLVVERPGGIAPIHVVQAAGRVARKQTIGPRPPWAATGGKRTGSFRVRDVNS